MRNARQILDIVLAAFGQDIFEPGSGTGGVTGSRADYQGLAHGWTELADSYAKYAEDDHSVLVASITKASGDWTHNSCRWAALTSITVAPKRPRNP
jgi:ethanolaminephosphotransferase